MPSLINCNAPRTSILGHVEYACTLVRVEMRLHQCRWGVVNDWRCCMCSLRGVPLVKWSRLGLWWRLMMALPVLVHWASSHLNQVPLEVGSIITSSEPYASLRRAKTPSTSLGLGEFGTDDDVAHDSWSSTYRTT